MNKKLTAKDFETMGYRRVSNKFGIIARVDRADWKEYMAKKHAPWDVNEGLKWVELLGEASAADQYRRVYSSDTIEVGHEIAMKIQGSGYDEISYVEKK